MRFLVVLCLLSAAVALPTPPEQLHTNLPALPPPPELKLEEKDKSGEEVALNIPPQPQIEEEIEKSGETMDDKDSKEKSKESKESKEHWEQRPEEPKESKEHWEQRPEEPKESKEHWEQRPEEPKESKEHWEQRPEEPKEQKKEKDSKESKEKDDEDVPVLIEIISSPKGWLSDLFSKWFPNHIGWPFRHWHDEPREEPIYIVSESDLDLD